MMLENTLSISWPIVDMVLQNFVEKMVSFIRGVIKNIPSPIYNNISKKGPAVS